MKMKKLLAIVLVLCMAVGLAACAATAGSDNQSNNQNAQQSTNDSTGNNDSTTVVETGDTYIIGCPQPLTGTNAQPGECALNAAKLAAKQFNENGGINGKKVEVLSYDDQGLPEEAVKLATRMVQADGVQAIIGSCISSCVLSSGKIYNDAKIPTLGTGTSPTWMAEGWEYVFRACQNNDFALPLVVNKLKELGVTKTAIFAGQDDAAVAGANTFTDLCKEAGIEITTSESYAEGNTDFSGQVAKIINSNPQVVFISTFGPTQPLIAKQLRQFGYNGLCFTKDLYQVDALNVAGAASNGIAFAYPYLTYSSADECDDPFIKDFLTAYEAEYGTVPVSDCAYRAYDSMLVLKAACEAAGSTDGEAVAKAVADLSGVQTLAGQQDFTKGDGEGLHEFNIFVIDNEKYMTWDKWEGTDGYNTVMEESGLN